MAGLDEYHTKMSGQPTGSWTSSWNSASVLGRNGHPEDVAKLVSFLVSDDSAFITGAHFTSSSSREVELMKIAMYCVLVGQSVSLVPFVTFCDMLISLPVQCLWRSGFRLRDSFGCKSGLELRCLHTVKSIMKHDISKPLRLQIHFLVRAVLRDIRTWRRSALVCSAMTPSDRLPGTRSPLAHIGTENT